MIIDLLAAVGNNTGRSFVQFSQIPLVTGRVTAPKDLHILIPGIHKSVRLHGRQEVRQQIG